MLARGGFVIRKMRKMRGYTQQRLAIEYGYHVNTISAWECGVKEPSFLTVFEIGRHLHFDIMNIYQMVNDISKAGVMLSDFYDPGMFQPGLFDDVSTHSNSQQLMSVLDTINQSGAGKVFFAGQGTKKDWSMKREHLSPAYTTRWDQLPRVK